jgi:hypothetical protein
MAAMPSRWAASFGLWGFMEVYFGDARHCAASVLRVSRIISIPMLGPCRMAKYTLCKRGVHRLGHDHWLGVLPCFAHRVYWLFACAV